MTNRTTSFFYIFALLAIAYWIINFLLLPPNHLISYPLNHDDYSALASQINLISWHNVRPISTFFIAFFALFGRVGYYLWMHGLTVLYASMVLYFIGITFSTYISLEWVIVYAALLFSLPPIINLGNYLGLATNLVSATFGMISAISLWQGYQKNKNSLLIIAAITFVCCIFAKEDFILLNFLLILFLLLFDPKKHSRQSERKKLFGLLLFQIAAVVMLVIFNSHIAHSAFTGDSAHKNLALATYAININPLSMFRVLIHYLTFTHYVRLVLAFILLTSTASIVFLTKANKLKTILIAAIILALILPYTILPNHIYNYYTYNWFPWEAALGAVGISMLISKFSAQRYARFVKYLKYIIIGFLIIFPFYTTYHSRYSISSWYEQNAVINKNMLSTLKQYRDVINQEQNIGIIGVNTLSPWSMNQGIYLTNNLKLKTKWLVFIKKNTIFFQITAYNQNLKVNVLGANKICSHSHVKYLSFDTNGFGRLISGKQACEQAKHKKQLESTS